MKLNREELAERCASTSFDAMAMDLAGKKVVYTHTFRDAQSTPLETFTTELHFSELQPRSPTVPEQRALLSFGLCHSTYVYLVAAKRAPLLQVRAGYFSPSELDFFRGALAGALAEYFYLADMDLADFKLECCCDAPPAPPAEDTAAAVAAATTALPESKDKAQSNETASPAAPSQRRQQHPPRVLVPFGGGKDSTLLMELLSSMGAQVGWVYYGEWAGSWTVYTKFKRLAAASPAACPVVLVEQSLPDLERLKELNLVPDLRFEDYTAYVSFYTFASAVVALQLEYDYICVGNEQSANAINTTHPRYNYPVNHQYEKSYAAEVAFHTYLQTHIAPGLYYFSGLQHMTELEIAHRFAALCAAKYLHLIISCNWAMDDDWCGGCEKCAFVFLLFAAFLPVPEIMSKVFGVEPPPPLPPNDGSAVAASAGDTSGPIVPGSRESLRCVYDMYDSERHVPVFESLMGLSGHKPFECVGTPEECLAAMYLACERYGCRDGGKQVTTEAGAEAGAASAAAAAGPGHAVEQTPDQQGHGGGAGGGMKLPLLLRKHLGLISSRGREEWEKIRESMRAVAETGTPGVPTLYPDWFKLGLEAKAGSGGGGAAHV